MKTTGKPCIYVGFFLGTILSWCFKVGLTDTEDVLTTTHSPSVLTTQNPTTHNPTDTTAISTTAALPETTALRAQISTSKPTLATHTTTPLTQLTTSKSPSAESSASPPRGSTLPPDVPPSPCTETGTEEARDEPKTKAELCEEKSQRVLLMCLVAIGALVFLCVCLLLAVAVLATKLSYNNRRQPSKRLPRTNGDFLSTSSLWPAGLETLQRISGEAPGTVPFRQSLRSETTAAGQGKTGPGASKTLASEISERQMQKETVPKETSVKRPSSTITNTAI